MESCPDDSNNGHDRDEEETSCESTYFVERDEVLARLTLLAGPEPPASLTGELEWLQKVLDKYLEQSTLLDPAMEKMLALTMGRARLIILSWQNKRLAEQVTAPAPSFPFQIFRNAQLDALFAFVYVLCRLRGRKTVITFFPHEATDLEPVLHALQSQDRQDCGLWQTRYILLLWLSMLVLVPFNICSIDSGVDAGQSGRAQSSVTLVGAICDQATEYLRDPGPTREAAAVCLASLLKRPDMECGQLAVFLKWAEGVLGVRDPSAGAEMEERGQRGSGGGGLEATLAAPGEAFLPLGVLQTLSVLLKAGHRQNLLAFLPSLLRCLAQGPSSDLGSLTLSRKLKIKLLQRVALAYLPPRVASWRYRRGQRSLLDNLRSVQEARGGRRLGPERGTEEGGEEEEVEEGKDEEDVPEALEDIVEELLLGLRDRDTVVRWSAAKGLGRIASRLPESYADEVVASVLSSFTESAPDSAWHGGCLALAELARRGSLLPGRLGLAVPVVTRALRYDVRRGQASVGAHVRDAACYVCWAFARAYSPQAMRPYVQRLATGMLLTALFDREINCRRAAAAAFQENVGRQGARNFAHGIAILAAADYFTLGNRQAAYLSIGPAVAHFPPYTRSIIEHLALVKLRHPDPSIRLLGSQALHRMAGLAPSFLLDDILPTLVAQVDALDLCCRHGALLGVAELLLGLSQLPSFLPGETLKAVVAIVPRIEQARLYRGRGGELVREAACRLIECLALALVPLSVKTQLRLLDSLDENLRHPADAVRAHAVAAIRAFTHAYFGRGMDEPSARLQARVVDKYRRLVETDENVAVTRGFLRALGALPARLLFPSFPALLDTIETQLAPNRRVGDEPDAETRRNGILALGEMAETLGVEVSGGGRRGARGMNSAQVHRLISLLLKGTGDYAMDKRGDVGSWVRMAALQGLEKTVTLVRRGGGGLTGGAVEESQEGWQDGQRPLRVGDWVLTTHGRGQVRDLRCNGHLCEIAFPPGQAGAYLFPYGPGCGLFPRQSCQPLSVSDGVKDARTDDAAATAVGTASIGDAGVGRFASSTSLISPELMTAIVSAVLKQLCEKLDAVRECAGRVLSTILPLARDAEAYSTLLAVFSSEAEGGLSLKGGDSAAVYPRAVRLLGVRAYHEAIVAGLVISVGGLTESVVKASVAAVVEWARQQRLSKRERQEECRSNACEDGHKMPPRLQEFFESLLGLFDAHSGNDRVIMPLLRSLDLFYQKGVLVSRAQAAGWEVGSEDGKHAGKASLSWRLADRLLREVTGCRNVTKLLACLRVALHLLSPLTFRAGQEEEEAGAAALRLILLLLGHRFPRVRKLAAQELYTALLLHDHLLAGGGDAQERVLEALLGAAWEEEDLQALCGVRDEICAVLVLAPLGAGGTVVSRRGLGGRKGAGEELASYAALVKEMGY